MEKLSCRKFLGLLKVDVQDIRFFDNDPFTAFIPAEKVMYLYVNTDGKYVSLKLNDGFEINYKITDEPEITINGKKYKATFNLEVAHAFGIVNLRVSPFKKKA